MKDLEQAKQIVLRFTEAMNDWETKMYIFSRVKDNKYVSDEKRLLVEGSSKETLDNYYYHTLDKYCTRKSRTIGGHPYSYGEPPKYSGVSSGTFLGLDKVSSNRIEVVVKSDYFLETIYMFVLLKKNNEWKIDSLKVQRDGKWDNDCL